jgi:hypothetical protein
MMLCDCDDDELAFVEATGGDDRRVAEIVGSNDATADAGDVDEINGEGFLLRFFGVGTEVGAGAGAGTGTGVGVGRGEAVAEMGESASGD